MYWTKIRQPCKPLPMAWCLRRPWSWRWSSGAAMSGWCGTGWEWSWTRVLEINDNSLKQLRPGSLVATKRNIKVATRFHLHDMKQWGYCGSALLRAVVASSHKEVVNSHDDVKQKLWERRGYSLIGSAIISASPGSSNWLAKFTGYDIIGGAFTNDPWSNLAMFWK